MLYAVLDSKTLKGRQGPQMRLVEGNKADKGTGRQILWGEAADAWEQHKAEWEEAQIGHYCAQYYILWGWSDTEIGFLERW